MMDRNLGATSATPGDVGALGLLYQWGRKDPFLGASSISTNVLAKSTGIWPSAVSSSTSVGTVDYVTANPTTFVMSSSPYDWHYSSRDNTLWQSEKSIYDPCPAGWRVPDGGTDGVWAKALELSGYAQQDIHIYPYCKCGKSCKTRVCTSCPRGLMSHAWNPTLREWWLQT